MYLFPFSKKYILSFSFAAINSDFRLHIIHHLLYIFTILNFILQNKAPVSVMEAGVSLYFFYF